MRRSRASAVHLAGDRVLSAGRRILARVGLNGAKSWHVPDTIVSGWSHPDSTTERVCLRTPPIPLTPGHLLKASVVCVPSGMTTQSDGLGGYEEGGVKGEVKITVAWDNGLSTPTTTKTLTLPNSKLANGAQPTGAGAAWNQLYTLTSGPMAPDDMTDPALLSAWTEGVYATITVSYIGSPRVIDLVIHEEPNALCYNLASGDWIAPMLADGSGGPLGQIHGKTPRIKRSASDPSGGSEIVVDSAVRVAQEVGPVLLYHTAWDEDAQPVADTETLYRAITATANYTELIHGSTTAAGTTRPGWSVASGANATRVQDSEASVVLRDNTNVVPVRCYVYGAMSTAAGSPTAKVRFQRDANEYIQVDVSAGTTYAWHSAPGFLRCGLGAQDPHAIQVSAVVTANEFRWRYLCVVYNGTLGT